ncbi:MAG: hypothetical protein WD601_02290, partial [Pseudohongiellaceae bacterium]
LRSDDFCYYRHMGNYFPKPKNVSTEVEFLLYVFSRLSEENKLQVIRHWYEGHQGWPDWLMDGISYHFIPETSQGDSWAPILQARLELSGYRPHEETLRLKYSSFFSDD